MLSFELSPATGAEKPAELIVYFDHEGRELLFQQLMLIASGKTDHVHLMSESWGGDELTDAPIEQRNSLICHVKIIEISPGRVGSQSERPEGT